MHPKLSNGDLPALFQEADRVSLRGQAAYIRATKIRLTLAVAAAVLAALTFKVGSTWDLPALVAACAFVATLIIELWLFARTPERDWYDGRALAESIKTLSWRYSIGAAPFPLGSSGVELRFIEEVQKLVAEAPADAIVIAEPVSIPDKMRDLRNSSLAIRRQSYLEYRIGDQLGWYANRSKLNSSRAHGWRLALISVEGLGVIAAMLKAGSIVDFDLPGILAAVLGAGSAWFAVRQYESLARAYGFAASDLGTVHARLQSVSDEDGWARETADAEEAISREHTMWRASRGAFMG